MYKNVNLLTWIISCSSKLYSWKNDVCFNFFFSFLWICSFLHSGKGWSRNKKMWSPL